MNSPLPPFSALKAFEAVGRLGGIRRAAKSLGISHAIVSRHVRGLEERLGATLLDRDSGQLTAVGFDYHGRLMKVFNELREATAAVRARTDGKLVISCVGGLALHWLAARLAMSSGQNGMPPVDLRSEEALLDLSNNAVDGDIRYIGDCQTLDRKRGVRTVELARPHVFPLASPMFIARWGDKIRSAEDLAKLPLIEERSDVEWRMWMKAQSIDLPPNTPTGRYGHAHLALAAARAGQGVALGNHYLIAEDLAAGRLVKVMPREKEFLPVALGAYVFRGPANRWSDPSIVRFRRWLGAQFSADPAY
ncbi:LysR family transcriptional regulator [Sphingomonadales bacterium 56]|uniref:LysR substrate-binding domain-containing protein n=1 Tax=unclassified Sphingobium TaxID=2611147 RepID=UPI001917BB1A|nr:MULTISPECIES: LysR substrate-binding domain-containing protein [unclassified Sphingobium]MBY2930332.1 LysR family transcriptional regulator [Sphingomonadales bacterium 56]MBY2960376.1 LysR family transcriptional regulator [Sphingomonadales bacterium 58]CAD7340984.1 Glycine cleavage system transcriptional activator [Sphingobium sp. S8]CAD7341107.1 Glycine cleavage system transcriptional activator [Sphingobium sp. S6]